MKPDEVTTYFLERFKNCGLRMIPKHWSRFRTKEEVDEYMDTIERIKEAFRKDKV